MVNILSMVDLTSISALLAAIGVLVGVVFAILELRNLVKTRQTDLTLRLHSVWTTEGMLELWQKIYNLKFKDYADFEKRYGSWLSENPEQTALTAVINHFEVVGYLMQRKMIDHGLVDLMPVSMTWTKLKPIVEGIREQYASPRIYEMIEYAYNEVQKYREQRLQQTQS